MNSLSRFFKKFDNFLTTCVDYLGNRIITGKFIKDIFDLLGYFFGHIGKKCKKILVLFKKSSGFDSLSTALRAILRLFRKLAFFNVLFNVISETIKIIIISYSEIFIVFAITFPLTILLLSWFQTAIVTFFIAIIPFMIIDTVCFSALFYSIDRRELGDRISIWESILFVIRHDLSILFPIITTFAVLLEIFVVFIFISFVFGLLFDIFHISWSGSVVYWFIISVASAITVISYFAISILTIQTYLNILIDHIPFHEALKRAVAYVEEKSFYYLFFYILLYVLCGIFTVSETLRYLYFGFTIGIYSTITFGTILGYILRKKLPPNQTPYVTNLKNKQKIHIVFKIITVFGFINYILISFLLIKQYTPFTTFIQQQQDNYLASLEEKKYTSKAYHYAIQYPQNWSFYQWQNNSVTFYNNYTRTLTGGTWMTITISPAKGSNFTQLFNASPGVIPNTSSKNSTTKVTNITVQGYPGVNYLFIKPGVPYTQYESHYVILKGNSVYDISFTSVTNDVASYDSDLFQKIVNSFSFTQ